MNVLRAFLLCFLVICCVKHALSSAAREGKTRRFNLPSLGIGYSCGHCPEHFCDDDEGIIYGYCCGCAAFYDHLPIKCSSRIECPPNGYDLCDDYEYMMHCCC